MLDILRIRFTARRPDAAPHEGPSRPARVRAWPGGSAVAAPQTERIDAIGSSLAHLNPVLGVSHAAMGIVRDANGKVIRDAALVGPGEGARGQGSRGGHLEAIVTASHPASGSEKSWSK